MPVAKALTFKQALIAAAGLGAVGATVAPAAPPGDVVGLPGDEAPPPPAPPLRERLAAARGAAGGAAAAARALSRSWSPYGGAAKGAERRDADEEDAPALAAFAAHYLGALGEAAAGAPGPLAATRLARWMLVEAAGAPAGSAAAARAACFVADALGDRRAAAALLASPGVPAALLALAAGSPPLQAALCAAAAGAPAPRAATPRDVAAAVAAARRRDAPEALRLAALRLLRRWAAASVVNCAALAEAGAGGVLAVAVAAAAASDGGALAAEVAALAAALAAGTPARALHALELPAWPYQLLCLAADAAGAGNAPAARAALGALGAALRRGAGLPDGLLRGSALPLLRRLGEGADAGARAAAARAVAALAEARGVALRDGERLALADALLERLPDPWAPPADAAAADEAAAAVEALAALAATPGPAGAHVAAAWLAELIVRLSRDAERRAARAPGDAAQAGGWRGWGRRPPPPAAPDTSNAAAAAAVAAAVAPPPPPAEPPAGSWDVRAWWAGGAGGWPALPAPAAGWDPLSWWRGAAGGAPSAAPAPPPSDPELSLLVSTSAVGPAYARSLAAALLEASGRVGAPLDPPPDAEEALAPAAVRAYGRAAAAVDAEVAAEAACRALKALAALAAGEPARRRWLARAGALPLLRRLAAGETGAAGEDGGEEAVEPAGGAGGAVAPGAAAALSAAPLGVRRQVARMLAMLSGDADGAAAVAAGGWERWLRRAARSADLKAASSAARALLHLQSAAAVRGEASEPGPLAAALRRLDGAPPRPAPADRLVLMDGVHLLDPGAPHHAVLAARGAGDASADAPEIDVVFVHGIRGGAFATWRREGSLARGAARDALARHAVWPSAWLAPELPGARLLSVEYAAPASWWEGDVEALPFRATAAGVAERLAAAGVGRRPVVFVAHSLGGLVVKDILARGAALGAPPAQAALAAAATGAVFYSVPHFGSRLADWGLYLGYLGAAPAAHVPHLATHAPHLEELNAGVRAAARAGQLRVLSLGEGRPTRLRGPVSALVVPLESAYPGYGEFAVLAEHDHISVCKPTDKTDPAYALVAAFLRERASAAAAAAAARRAAGADAMAAAL
jgi:hypothetical protein